MGFPYEGLSKNDFIDNGSGQIYCLHIESHTPQSKAGTHSCGTLSNGASLWQSPEKTRSRGLGLATKPTNLRNQCLRLITGAYKATNVKALEAEPGVMPLDKYLNQTVWSPRNSPRCAEVINFAQETIRTKLCGRKEGDKRQPGDDGSEGGMGQRHFGKNSEGIK